ncbi:hypothetical protein Tco_0869076, partial [Tanacetum coccineum]
VTSLYNNSNNDTQSRQAGYGVKLPHFEGRHRRNFKTLQRFKGKQENGSICWIFRNEGCLKVKFYEGGRLEELLQKNEIEVGCNEDSPSISQGTTFKAVVQPDLTNLPENLRKESNVSDRKDAGNRIQWSSRTSKLYREKFERFKGKQENGSICWIFRNEGCLKVKFYEGGRLEELLQKNEIEVGCNEG